MPPRRIGPGAADRRLGQIEAINRREIWRQGMISKRTVAAAQIEHPGRGVEPQLMSYLDRDVPKPLIDMPLHQAVLEHRLAIADAARLLPVIRGIDTHDRPWGKGAGAAF